MRENMEEKHRIGLLEGGNTKPDIPRFYEEGRTSNYLLERRDKEAV